jgi:hypothetical protein
MRCLMIFGWGLPVNFLAYRTRCAGIFASVFELGVTVLIDAKRPHEAVRGIKGFDNVKEEYLGFSSRSNDRRHPSLMTVSFPASVMGPAK